MYKNQFLFLERFPRSLETSGVSVEGPIKMTSRGLIQPVNKDENNDIEVVISYVYVFLVFAKNNRLYWWWNVIYHS